MGRLGPSYVKFKGQGTLSFLVLFGRLDPPTSQEKVFYLNKKLLSLNLV